MTPLSLFVSQGERKRIYECLCAVTDGLKRARREAGDRAGIICGRPCWLACPARSLDQIDGAGDIGIDHADDFTEILIQETLAEASSGIREQGVDRTSIESRRKLLHAFNRCQIGFDGPSLSHGNPSRPVNFRLVCGDDQVKAVLRATTRKFVANPGGGSGHHGDGRFCLFMSLCSEKRSAGTNAPTGSLGGPTQSDAALNLIRPPRNDAGKVVAK